MAKSKQGVSWQWVGTGIIPNKGKYGANQVSKYSSIPITSVLRLALIVFRVGNIFIYIFLISFLNFIQNFIRWIVGEMDLSIFGLIL